MSKQITTLIIGNGFDLAHGLPTSYKEFLRFCQCVNNVFDGSVINRRTVQKILNMVAHEQIREKILNIFDSCTISSSSNGSRKIVFCKNHEYMSELINYIHSNIWIKYFRTVEKESNTTWIDFETEIANVIKAFEKRKTILDRDESATNDSSRNGEIINKINSLSEKEYHLNSNLDDFDLIATELDSNLQMLIRALEIYIAFFVNEIDISRSIPDIEGLCPDRILSFNYSNTYGRVYGTKGGRIIDFVHGKATQDHDINSCNMVVGIDDYLDEKERNEKLDYLCFKKYYQRIIKETSSKYLEWEREIEEDRIDEYKNRRFVFYVFGHSLDVTDKDILKKLFNHENVIVKIFYYREFENDKRNLGKLIKNMIKIVGRDELIRRTGPNEQTIVFIPQTIVAKQ